MSVTTHRPSIDERLRNTLRLRQVEDELASLTAVGDDYHQQARRRRLRAARLAGVELGPSLACPDISKRHPCWENVYFNLGPNPERDSECAICQIEIGAGDQVLRHAGCDNCFHPDCLLSWVDVAVAERKTPSCPMCRQNFVSTGVPYAEVDSPVNQHPDLAGIGTWGISEQVRDGFYRVALQLAQDRASDVEDYHQQLHIDDPVQIGDWIEIEYERLSRLFDFTVDYEYLRQRFGQQEQRYRRRHGQGQRTQLRREEAFYHNSDEEPERRRRRR